MELNEVVRGIGIVVEGVFGGGYGGRQGEGVDYPSQVKEEMTSAVRLEVRIG